MSVESLEPLAAVLSQRPAAKEKITSPVPDPPPGGGESVGSLFCWATSIAVVCVPHLSHTRSCIAFPLLRISHLCVFRDILSPKAVYRVSCPFFRPQMFFPGDCVWYHSRTRGAHVLATVVGPSPNGLQFCHIRHMRPGGVTQVDHESAQLSRLEAVVVASPKSPEWPDVWGMCLMENCISLVIYVRKSGSLRIWRPQRSRCLPPRQAQSQPPNRLVTLRQRALNRLPNQPHAPVPPPHQPVPHTLCPLCKLNMCNSPKCAILEP